MANRAPGERKKEPVQYQLTNEDLPYLRAILRRVGVSDEESLESCLGTVEVVSEEEVATTSNVEVELGGESHAEYLAKIVCDLLIRARAHADSSPPDPEKRKIGTTSKADSDFDVRWIPGHDHHDSLPEQPGGGAIVSGLGGSQVEIGVEVWKAAQEAFKDFNKWLNEGGKKAPGPHKKHKVVHHPGKQWLDPGWHER
mgnify:CR=1 FL=1